MPESASPGKLPDVWVALEFEISRLQTKVSSKLASMR